MSKVINIEPTPNPNALKFVVKEPLLRAGARAFRDFASSVGDTLASSLFALGGVASVFYMDRFVTINKEQSANWNDLIDPVCDCIEDFLPRNDEDGAVPGLPSGSANEQLVKINTVLSERILPSLARDGGGLDVIDFDGTTLRIAYSGACGSCPSAKEGTLQFIESILKNEVDPLIKVVIY